MTGIWLIVLIAAILIELATMGLTTIWFAGGAAIACIEAALKFPLWLQIASFLIVSIVLLFFTRPIAFKYFNKNVTRTNSEALIGQKAVVVSDINNIEGLGRVLVEGKEWSAKAAIDGDKIPTGAIVIVKAIEGVKLLVQKVSEE
ncbi:MAG: NfeD family protein [Lachnospiraceae bacterium]|nr:NfeD family protein [Lachnospiraceae bacterium]